jgi:hypothetical protein
VDNIGDRAFVLNVFLDDLVVLPKVYIANWKPPFPFPSRKGDPAVVAILFDGPLRTLSLSGDTACWV